MQRAASLLRIFCLTATICAVAVWKKRLVWKSMQIWKIRSRIRSIWKAHCLGEFFLLLSFIFTALLLSYNLGNHTIGHYWSIKRGKRPHRACFRYQLLRWVTPNIALRQAIKAGSQRLTDWESGSFRGFCLDQRWLLFALQLRLTASIRGACRCHI